jgi:HlyD family secretion protein
MDSGIFRKVSLERLSSPEQLDQLLRVTTPKNWLALVALFAVLSVIVIWGNLGTIPTKAEGQGVIVRSGTVLNVVTVGSGLVTNLYVNPGDRVKPYQLVAKVAEPKELEKVRQAKEALDEALRDRQLKSKLREQSAKLRIEALARAKSNAVNQIKELHEQTKLVAEQITVDQQLLSKGLITREHTLATQQKLSALNGQIEGLQAQIKQYDAEMFAAKSEPIESDAQAKNDTAEKQRNLTGLEKELEMISNVVSPFAGQVVELKAVEGTLVEPGAPILSIQPEATQLEVIMYLPSERAKAVVAGMEAQVSPSIVKREEYGFIRGKVTYVADFPATPAAMMRNFENQTLVQSLLGTGPVTELHLALASDSNTYSGFRWSSGKGPPIRLSSGTMCTALVVTREQKPVSLLFPYVKERLGLT